MRVVIQRVSEASVRVDGEVTGVIGRGLLVLVGIEDSDGAADIEWLASKIVQLRIFDDDAGVMNRSLLDVGGELLLVSQFTLHASTRKGTRPSWHRASKPDKAIPLYHEFKRALEGLLGRAIPTGVFGADMKVSLINDGPVTLIIDSTLKD
jgi:D-tyrosyl-tRNA(Tyr) deacylase